MKDKFKSTILKNSNYFTKEYNNKLDYYLNREVLVIIKFFYKNYYFPTTDFNLTHNMKYTPINKDFHVTKQIVGYSSENNRFKTITIDYLILGFDYNQYEDFNNIINFLIDNTKNIEVILNNDLEIIFYLEDARNYSKISLEFKKLNLYNKDTGGSKK